MRFVPQQIEIVESAINWIDSFKTAPVEWEVTSNQQEESFFSDGYYWMKNKSETNWMFYENQFPFDKHSDYILDVIIELQNKDEYGHFGLIWGFDKEREVLNRFSLSADKQRCTIMKFQKDYCRTYHRYQSNLTDLTDHQLFQLTIVKLQDYFYFLLNGKTIYISHASHFINLGNHYGFYVEPGIFIKCHLARLSKLTSKPIPLSGDWESLINPSF